MQPYLFSPRWVPAAIHFAFNAGTLTQRGAGIPMATDIAFSLGVLSLFGTKVPYALKVFLTALAIADDLGAIVVIAVFYTKGITVSYLSGALAIFAILVVLNRTRVNILLPYLIGGACMWWCLLHSGVHATIGGVLLAFAIPFSKETQECVSHRLQHRLHFPVALGILPIFALVNTCIPIGGEWYRELMQPNAVGIFLGLVVGKPVGILAFCGLAIAFKIGRLADELMWSHLLGAGLLAGIGFTMSIFVSLLAFEDPSLVNISQITVLIASCCSAALGAVWFLFFIPKVSTSSLEPSI
jgi:NhaA family Na+:H+ antiporter